MHINLFVGDGHLETLADMMIPKAPFPVQYNKNRIPKIGTKLNTSKSDYLYPFVLFIKTCCSCIFRITVIKVYNRIYTD
jgi:hypothetical protein